MVWITKEGDAFHRNRHCPALIAGQRYAERLGQRTHEPEMVTYATPERADAAPACTAFPRGDPDASLLV
jgi:hypothetical protein